MAEGDLTRIRANIAALNALASLKNINKQVGVHSLRLACDSERARASSRFASVRPAGSSADEFKRLPVASRSE